MKRMLIISVLLVPLVGKAQWRNVGFGDINTLRYTYESVEFGVHDTTLFISWPKPDGGVFRYAPPSTWIFAEKGIDFTQGDITSFGSAGPFLFANGTPGYAAFVSTDRGLNWTKATTAGPIVSNGPYLFGQWLSHVSRSNDGAKNWEHLQLLPVVRYFTNGGTVYGTTSTSVWRSTDNGTTWDSTSAALSGPKNRFAAVGTIVFVANARLIKTTDSGTHWSEVVIPRRTVNALAATDRALFAATDSGVFVSIDTGANWRNVSDGMHTTGPTTYPNATAICVFDSTVFVDVEAGNQRGYLVARPISEMVPPKDAVVASALSSDDLVLYPNPASDRVILEYALPAAGEVTLTLLDALGRVQSVPFSAARMESGPHQIELDLHGLVRGVYWCRIERGGVQHVVTFIRR